jgi:sugar porter (SP) family MFS transporter
MTQSIQKYARFLLIMAGLGGLIYGIDVGVIAAALPYIRNTSDFSAVQLGFIVGAVLWGSVLSSLFAGTLSEWFGRKKIIIAAAFCFFVSIPIICASGFFDGGNFWLLILGRTLQGASAGLVGVVVPMYLAECLDSESRGKGTGMFQLLLVIGLAFAAAVGLVVTALVGDSDKVVAGLAEGARVSAELHRSWVMAWQTIFWCSAVPGLILFVGSFSLKESPRWLYKKGRVKEALASLAANNGEEKAKEILGEMLAADKAEKRMVKDASHKGDSLLQRKYIYPFCLAVVILACNQTTGINSVLNYTVDIFKHTGMTGVFANFSDLAIKLVNVFMTVVACYLVDRKGRKFLLKIGTSGIIVGLCGVGTVFLMIDSGIVGASIATGIVATFFFFLYIAFFAVGPGVCVWLALSELMPTRIRATGMSIAMIVNQGISATIASFFPAWVGSWGFAPVFYSLAACTVVYFVAAAFFLPETKGRSLEEIEQYFTTGKKLG